jgi:hypothetical protein
VALELISPVVVILAGRDKRALALLDLGFGHAWSLCTSYLIQAFNARFGCSISETTMRPSPSSTLRSLNAVGA